MFAPCAQVEVTAPHLGFHRRQLALLVATAQLPVFLSSLVHVLLAVIQLIHQFRALHVPRGVTVHPQLFLLPLEYVLLELTL